MKSNPERIPGTDEMTHSDKPMPGSEPVIDCREFARLKAILGGGLALVGFGVEAALTFAPTTHGSTAASGMAGVGAVVGSVFLSMGITGIKQRRQYGLEPTQEIVGERLSADQVAEDVPLQIEQNKYEI